MNDLLRKICNRGYGFYLAFKILKALIAVPWFIICAILIAIITPIYYFCVMIKTIFTEVLPEIGQMVVDYWSKPWFRHFSKDFWLYLYRRKPIEFTVEDV